MTGLLIKIGGSLVAILLLAWLSRLMGLGGDIRSRDEAHARELAEQAVCGFAPVAVVVDRAGIGALLRDADGRQLLLRRHGVHFVGRLLDDHAHIRLDRTSLTVGTGERLLDPINLNLGQQAQIWAAGMRDLRA